MRSYFDNYYENLHSHVSAVDQKLLLSTADLIKDTKKMGGKVIVVGNGGSASIASHVAIDLTKAARIQSITFNESSLITCLANDFDYSHWVGKAISYYANRSDLIILISSSGLSSNMINGANEANALGIPLVTFSGFSSNNKLRDLGQLNFWVNSSSYNIVENVHQVWLLSIIDFLIDSNTSDGVIV